MKAFDDILGLYLSEVERNRQSMSGPMWNFLNTRGGPNFKCGDDQDRVLKFLSSLLFRTDLKRCELMDGFDFGPLTSGPRVIRFTHHFVVIWPRGTWWKQTGESIHGRFHRFGLPSGVFDFRMDAWGTAK